MYRKEYLDEICNTVMIEITKKMTGIAMVPNSEPSSLKKPDSKAVKLSIKDLDDNFSFLYIAHPQVYKKIAESMKKSKILDDSEAELYVKEYFNTICGRIVSRINREIQTSYRFGIPSYFDNADEINGISVYEKFYKCGADDHSVSLVAIIEGKQ